MPRAARKRSVSGIYHIMLRGADRRIIFADDEDHETFLSILSRVRERSEFDLYAWCLMGNHVHLLLREGKEPLELIFKRIGVTYVQYYNWKYQLNGHLFQDRFRSEPVETDAYFLDVIRYICQNPVKAKLCSSPFDYPWLGCSGISSRIPLSDVSEVTSLRDKELAEFAAGDPEHEHLDDTGVSRLTDREAIQRLLSALQCDSVQEIALWAPEQRDEAIRTGKELGISIRQFSRLTAISKAVIERVLR